MQRYNFFFFDFHVLSKFYDVSDFRYVLNLQTRVLVVT